jgi:NAD-dependent deacetylase
LFSLAPASVLKVDESPSTTFRDSDGLWEGYNIEDVATPRAWKKDPALVLEFYNMRRRNVADALPNDAHITLASLEEKFEVSIITQNIDDLHERGGSTNVLHLHGQIFKMRGEKDYDTWYDIREDMKPGSKAPDGSLLRPAIVWFEEAVPAMGDAINIVRTADLLVIIGTSLVVYPAASLVQYAAPGIPLFIVDKKIPSVQLPGLTRIEMPATEGVKHLQSLLCRDHSAV